MLGIQPEAAGTVKRRVASIWQHEFFEACNENKVECRHARIEPLLRHYYQDVWEVGEPHHLPHFHAYYQNDVAVYGINPIELIEGSLPRRQRRLVEAWAELHQSELAADWERLQAGLKPVSIEPLK